MRTAALFVFVTAVSLLAWPVTDSRGDDDADYRACRDEEDPNLALAACSRAIESPRREPIERARILNNRAIVLTELGQQRAAIADYSEVLKDYPGEYKIWNKRGRLYRQLNDYDQAIHDFTKAIELRPSEAVYLSNRGLAYKQKGDHGRAIADYDAALRIEPDNDVTLHNRGVLHRLLKNFGKALTDLERSLSLDPDDVSTMTEIGGIYADQQRHDEAVTYFDRAIAQAPKYGNAWFQRGLSYRALGRHDLALRDLEQAEKLGINDNELFAALTSLRRIAAVKMVLKATSPTGGVDASPTGGAQAPGKSAGGSGPVGVSVAQPPTNPDFDMGGELDF